MLAVAIGAAACTSTPSEPPSAVEGESDGAPSATTAPATSLSAANSETDATVSAPAASMVEGDTMIEAVEPADPDGSDAELEGSEPPVASEPPSGYIAVSVGTSHACAITVAGELECWGDRTERRTEAPAGTYTAISAGRRHSCALSTEGEISCWGSSDFGRLDAPNGTYIAIDVGRFQSCALAENGSAHCWGLTASPAEGLNPADGYLDIAAGVQEACAVTRAGRVACWGSGGYSDTLRRNGFVLDGFVSIAGEDEYGGGNWCALSDEGQLRCWGDLTEPGGGSGFLDISVGGRHGCAVTLIRRILCWPQRDNRRRAPAGDFTSVATGSEGTCGIESSGDVVCWGDSYEAAESPPPDRFTALAAGYSHTCGLTVAGEVRCWGKEPQYNWDNEGRRLVSKFSVSEVAAYLAAAAEHTCVISVDGELSCQGDDYHLLKAHEEAQPRGPFVSVSSHEERGCALAENGKLTCWGQGGDHQADVPSGTYSAVAVGRGFICAISVEGRAVCWGDNRYGRTEPPPGEYTAIAAGWSHACGLMTDGRVVCWGRNDYGQMDVPDGAYSRIATNERHSCALTVEGEVKCWGFNDMGQLDAPGGTYIDIVTGLNHSCALTPEGGAVCWGHGDRRSSRTPTARGSEEPIRVELPNDLAGCCTYEEPDFLVELDSGFVKIIDNTPDGEYHWAEYPPSVYFSRDSQTWQRVDLPARYVGGLPVDGVEIWVCSVDSWGDGVIIRAAINDFYAVACGDHTYWSADGDLTNWRKLLAAPAGFGEKADD